MVIQTFGVNSLELVLATLLAVVASRYLARVLSLALPLPLMQIGLGADPLRCMSSS